MTMFHKPFLLKKVKLMVNTNIYMYKTKKPFYTKGFFFAVLLTLYFQNLQAQFFDSIYTSLKYKPKIDFRLDGKTSFIGSSYARISSIRLGVDFNKTFKLGIGYNWLSNDIHNYLAINNSRNEIELVHNQLKMEYISVYGEYVFFRDKKWEIAIQASLGGGFVYNTYWDKYWIHHEETNSLILVYEPHMMADYKIIRFLGIGGGVGFRLATSNYTVVSNQLNSPIYVYRLKIYIEELYTSIKKISK